MNTSVERQGVELGQVVARFQMDGIHIHTEPYGYGHINDTYAVYFKHEFSRPVRYILQRINHRIFHDPAALMANIKGVTEWLRDKTLAQGGDPAREVMRIVPARDGAPFWRDEAGLWWRAYHFVDDAVSYQSATPALFGESGAAFGRFLHLLDGYPAHTLHESIPGFHDTRARFRLLEEAVAEDPCGRAAAVAEEIAFAMARRGEAGALVERLEAGALPLRVTHNDTKLNNVMIDSQTGRGICVIDLDTVMPGLSLYDFGDSIRFGASTAAEDERDLARVSLDLDLFETFAAGYLAEAGSCLTGGELELLPFGAKLMTFECGLRFLTDYLRGDRYFKVHREGHNLDRCRTQFVLVRDMEEKMEQMREIVSRHTGGGAGG